MNAIIVRPFDHYKLLGLAIGAYATACASISPVVARLLAEQEVEFNAADVNIWICLVLCITSMWYLRESYRAYRSEASQTSVPFTVASAILFAMQLVILVPYLVVGAFALMEALGGGRSFG